MADLRQAVGNHWADGQRELAASRSVEETLDKLRRLIEAEDRLLADHHRRSDPGSPEFFRRLPAPAFIKGSRFRYRAVNPAFEATFGRGSERVVGRTDFEVFGQALGSRLWLQDVQALSGQATPSVERLPAAGEERPFLMIRAALGDAPSEKVGLLGIAVDLSHANRVDAGEVTAEAALNAMGDAVAIVDSKAVIRFANEAFSRLTRYAPGEAAGLDARVLDPEPDDRDFYSEMRRSAASRRTWRGSRLCRRQDGGLFWSELTIAPILPAGSTPMLYLLALRDVTAQRNLVDTLQRSALLKSELTAAISHELRTPLTAIKEAIELVAQRIAGPVNEKQMEFLALARRNIDRLHRIIDDTLDLSRLESGSVSPAPKLRDFNELVGDVVLRMQPLAERAGFEVTTAFDTTLPLVWIDPRHVDRALQIVLDNAIRHAVPGWVAVSTSAGRGKVRVTVADSGPGIAEDARQSIFEPYVQLSVGPGRKVGGAGLGLSISKRLVEANRGKIWVESEPGTGSTFHLEFPALDRASQGDLE